MGAKRSKVRRPKRRLATKPRKRRSPRSSTGVTLFDTLRERKLSDDACFLCGTALDAANRSDEHVVPRWAQKRFDLWDKRLVLLNGSSIQYRYLTIPCCKECNGCSLHPVETAMAEATLQGPEAVRGLGRDVLFTWLGKIFYGLMHRELFLALDRRDATRGSIATPELIETFSLHHLFLQRVTVPMVFSAGLPASIFVCETTEDPEGQHRWDFRDNLPNLFISVRVGRTGLIAVLQDGGMQEAMTQGPQNLGNFFTFPLHPIQFAELAAMICYKSLLSNAVPKFVIGEGPGRPVDVIQAPMGGLSGNVRFRDWDWAQYAKLLHYFTWQMTGLDVGDLHNPQTGATMTWLKKPDGSVAGTMPF